MIKTISHIGTVALLGMVAALFYADRARASGTYKIEHGQGWGCCCVPNVAEFGYFRTEWREWPCEERRDKTFPRSIGMEAIPAPQGQVIVPPPRASAAPKGPGAGAGTEQGVEKPAEGLPAEGLPPDKSALPGTETPPPALPGLPQEPGGINPLGNLPSDLGAPKPLVPKESEESAPGTEAKPEAGPKTEMPEQGNTDQSNPAPKPEDKDTTLRLRGNGGNRLSGAGRLPSTARSANYNEPAQLPMAARLSRSVSQQSYQSAGESNQTQAAARSEVQSAASSGDARQDAPAVAVEGFCPVELALHGRWVQGDPRWTVVYKGTIYRLSGAAQRQEFLANPEKYVPANNGCDPVVSITQRRNIPGQVSFCAAYQGRIYMFASAATQEYFHNNPEPYVEGATK
jgi:YHS domain-containing protein